MKRLLSVFIFLALVLPAVAQADFYMRTKVTTSGLVGLGGSTARTESWISGKKQVEVTKVEINSPVLKMFMDGTETSTITDLENGVITTMDLKDKTYQEVSFAAMQERMKALQEQMSDAYTETKDDAERPMPTVTGGEIRVESRSTGEKKKFAGLESERTVLIMRSTGKDENTGEEVTYKIVYDAWLTPEIPGQAERQAFATAYAEAFQVELSEQITEGNLGLITAMQASGVNAETLAPHLKNLQGFPAKMTVRLGTELSEEQRKELQEAMQEKEKSEGGGGGLSIGGFGKKLKASIGDKLSEKMVQSLFGDGVAVDEDGDPVFFTMTTELEKVESKSVKPEKFEIPKGFKPATP